MALEQDSVKHDRVGNNDDYSYRKEQTIKDDIDDEQQPPTKIRKSGMIQY